MRGKFTPDLTNAEIECQLGVGTGLAGSFVNLAFNS